MARRGGHRQQPRTGDLGAAARADLERELAEDPNHLYARECAAHTWYALGAIHWRHGRAAEARAAFAQALHRVAMHPMARGALAALDHPAQIAAAAASVPASVDAALGAAVALTLAGDRAAAARLLETALDAAPPGSTGWVIPIDPLLDAPRAPEPWPGVLARVRARAA